MRKILTLSLLATIILSLTGCSEYHRMLKSTDAEAKLEYARRAFEQKKYTQSATVLADIVTMFKGTAKAEESLYLLAMSHYENRDYESSTAYFRTYYNRYPKGIYSEMARFYAGYGLYLDSPEPQLDQSSTIKAIEELQSFLDYYPKSDKVPSAQNAIFELQDKLTLKELQNAQLYYNLGTYLGNNYRSAIIVAKNAIKNYPYSKYKEDLELVILKSTYQEAANSIEERKADRFRDVIDEYYSFINNWPESKHRNEADNILHIAQKYVKD